MECQAALRCLKSILPVKPSKDQETPHKVAISGRDKILKRILGSQYSDTLFRTRLFTVDELPSNLVDIIIYNLYGKSSELAKPINYNVITMREANYDNLRAFYQILEMILSQPVESTILKELLEEKRLLSLALLFFTPDQKEQERLGQIFIKIIKIAGQTRDKFVALTLINIVKGWLFNILKESTEITRRSLKQVITLLLTIARELWVVCELHGVVEDVVTTYFIPLIGISEPEFRTFSCRYNDALKYFFKVAKQARKLDLVRKWSKTLVRYGFVEMDHSKCGDTLLTEISKYCLFQDLFTLKLLHPQSQVRFFKKMFCHVRRNVDQDLPDLQKEQQQMVIEAWKGLYRSLTLDLFNWLLSQRVQSILADDHALIKCYEPEERKMVIESVTNCAINCLFAPDLGFELEQKAAELVLTLLMDDHINKLLFEGKWKDKYKPITKELKRIKLKGHKQKRNEVLTSDIAFMKDTEKEEQQLGSERDSKAPKSKRVLEEQLLDLNILGFGYDDSKDNNGWQEDEQDHDDQPSSSSTYYSFNLPTLLEDKN